MASNGEGETKKNAYTRTASTIRLEFRIIETDFNEQR
jgi:hypothetical protein